MKPCALLDCTLRDGGYITDWQFGEETIRNIINGLINAKIDYVECGYLSSKPYEAGSTIFHNIEQIAYFLPENRGNSTILVMADVAQFAPSDITPWTGNSVDGIRVVFYRHQIEEALDLCRTVAEQGYKLFVQPMVTIDYTLDEYMQLIQRLKEFEPYAVSVVDSFGYMDVDSVKNYFNALDELLPPSTIIGFHSHNNMQLSVPTAQAIMADHGRRKVVIDASLYGMGRGAGNLCTEVISDYYNHQYGEAYDVSKLLELLGNYIIPIHRTRKWGYDPYLFITGRYHCHPNFACYLLENHNISVTDFERYIQLIPDEMKTKCRRPYVESLYCQFLNLSEFEK